MMMRKLSCVGKSCKAGEEDAASVRVHRYTMSKWSRNEWLGRGELDAAGVYNAPVHYEQTAWQRMARPWAEEGWGGWGGGSAKGWAGWGQHKMLKTSQGGIQLNKRG